MIQKNICDLENNKYSRLLIRVTFGSLCLNLFRVDVLAHELDVDSGFCCSSPSAFFTVSI